MNPPPTPDEDPQSPLWSTTRWALVTEALAEGGANSEEALHELYQQYEKPIRVTLAKYLRRWSWVKVELDDAVQDFLLKSFHVEALREARDACSRGRKNGGKLKLREFFSARLHQFAVTNFVRHWGAEARNPGKLVRFEDLPPEVQGSLEPLDLHTGEWEFDRQCAISLIDEAVDGLEAAHEMEGKVHEFKVIMPWILDTKVLQYSEIAAALEITENQLKAHVERLRSRLRMALRHTVKETLDNPTEEEVTAEVNELIRLFSSER